MAANTGTDKVFPSLVDISIKGAAVLILVGWSLLIILPFLIPIIWGAILAVACAPVCSLLTAKLKGRRKLASFIISVLLILAILLPFWMVADSIISGAHSLRESITSDQIRIPPPNEQVRSWPVIGEPLFKIWGEAEENLGKVIKPYTAQIQAVALRFLAAISSLGMTVLQFIFASILAGVFLAYGEKLEEGTRATINRIDKKVGQQFLVDAVTTIRNVAKGILGVAFIQAVMAGIGLAAVGIPAAGLWAMLCLVLGIIQVGAGIVMVPAVIYVFFTKSLVFSIPFLIWGLIVTLSDNILKPILLGQGAPVPMLVVFMGSIGGLLNHGLIGLFVGAVVLSLGYKLVVMWVGTYRSSP